MVIGFPFVEHHNAYVLPFTNTGKPLSVSKGGGSLPQKKISHIVGRDVHIVADHMFWTKGTENAQCSTQR